MNGRNRYLHSRYHWDVADAPDAGPTMYTHRGKTGENVAARISEKDLYAAADALMHALMDITISVQTVTQELNIEAQYWDRVYNADLPAD